MTFLQYWVEKLPAWLGIEMTTLDLCSQSGAHDLSATATPAIKYVYKKSEWSKYFDD